MKKIVVILLSVFAFVACSKDDNVQFVDSMDDLNNTFWMCNRNIHIAVYDEHRTFLYEVPDDSGDAVSGGLISYIYLTNDRFCTFYEMIGNPLQRFVYSEDSYFYNPSAKILKAGEIEYTLIEFSKERLQLQYAEERDSKTYVYTKTYEPWLGNNKSWNEWVDYMNSENSKLQ